MAAPCRACVRSRSRRIPSVHRFYLGCALSGLRFAAAFVLPAGPPTFASCYHAHLYPVRRARPVAVIDSSMFKLTNTLTGEQEVFEPQDKETARMYTCGPTVYNFVHIGNLRTFVFQDILRRHLSSKWNIRHVMNITDIDDKIIARSIETGQDIKSYTTVYTTAFFEDCERLRIQKPEIIAPATEHIEEMIDLVNRLLAAGYAYREGDSIYYRISRFPAYGRLSKLDKRELKVGARIDAEKMSKSKGNFYALRDLLDKGYDALTIRYLLVSVRYRKQLNFTLEGLKEAQAALDRIKEFLFRLNTAKLRPGNNATVAGRLAASREQFEAALDDDLNTSGALAAIFVLISDANIALEEGRLGEENRAEIQEWFKVIDARLGIVPAMEPPVLSAREVEEIEAMVQRRNEAKRVRDFALSDQIRRQLRDRGIVIEDTREGTRWRRK